MQTQQLLALRGSLCAGEGTEMASFHFLPNSEINKLDWKNLGEGFDSEISIQILTIGLHTAGSCL